MGFEELVETGQGRLDVLVDLLAGARQDLHEVQAIQRRETRELGFRVDAAERRVAELRDEIRYLLGLD